MRINEVKLINEGYNSSGFEVFGMLKIGGLQRVIKQNNFHSVFNEGKGIHTFIHIGTSSTYFFSCRLLYFQ